MATYLYRCLYCGSRQSSGDRTSELLCFSCRAPMKRDYKAENVGVAVQQLKNEREMGAGYDKLFLPDNKDFAGPGDPDGTAGMRKWREEHQPKAGNKNPRWPGTVEKKVM